MKKIKFLKKPSSKIVFRYCIIASIFLVLCAILLPVLLNYAPSSINTDFDIKMSYISYTQQFLIIGILVLSLIFFSTKLLLKDIDKWYMQKDSSNIDDSMILKVRKKCFNLPYIIFIFEILIPTLAISFIIFFTGSHHVIMIVKVLILVISFVLLLAVFTYIFSKDLYNNILAKTYKENINIGLRLNLKYKIAIQIIPLFVTILLITSFIGYSRSIKEKEDIFFNIYHDKLLDTFSSETTYSIDEIKELLNNISTYNTSHSKFLILDDSVITLSGEEPSEYIIEYTKDLSYLYDGRTYDSYGVDTQGATILVNTYNGPCYICITYNISSMETIYFLLFSFVFLLFIIILTLTLFSNSLSKDIKNVSFGLNRICEHNDINADQKLPVISNDEIGDLVIAFNKVQDLNNMQVTKIKDSQETLMEKERLASLGQLIGGIAHNLKTPIMSISGATEGLSDLIKEYDSSIGDPEVNQQDHHDIAKDMNTWVYKIREYTEYMSDIITAVKGQAVAMSNENDVSFTIGELLKRVNILMKHELKNSIIYLNISMKADENIIINGDVNSLVQVINNMISNSIQAYNGKPEQSIDLVVKRIENDLIISITDYASGIPKKVSDKLFKEMVTTKGKNGTGLGLYMSYSTIKAHFNGNITVESEENVGTTFNIILPL